MKILPMQEDQFEALNEIVARCYDDNAVYRFVCEEVDDETRKKFTHDFLGFRLKFGYKNGAVRVTEDGNGYAIWLAPGVSITPQDMQELGGFAAMQAAGPSVQQRFGMFVKLSSEMEAKFAPMPHYHLAPIVVKPEMQGKGLGSALLRDQLAIFDANGDYVYLDTQTQKNKEIYKRFGFEVMFEGVIPGTNVPHISMLRKPQGK